MKIQKPFKMDSPLRSSVLETPLGPMIAMADAEFLYLLEFMDGKHTATKIQEFTEAPLVQQKTDPIDSIENELRLYFQGKLIDFKTSIKMEGSPFQIKVWSALQKIPIGTTFSYADIAKAIQQPKAVRAVGGANGANPLAIMVPCHRVIRSNGDLGGYASSCERKKWLLEHERGP